MQAPYYPIIYVRGYAMTEDELNQAVADPFYGFNTGSTLYRAHVNRYKPPRRYIFESPVIRLRSDFGYSDTYSLGVDQIDDPNVHHIEPRSIIIYRYYDEAAPLFGVVQDSNIETFAKGLSHLILRVKDKVCSHPDVNIDPNDFRCYLVAHSLGGLICRAFLQNDKLGSDAARQCVDKVFTYGTPHNGIDFLGLKIPPWMGVADVNTFSPAYMANYLDIDALYKKTDRADWLRETDFPIERFFCMIGTNRADYDVALGLSSAFSGPGSDGLVKQENASVWRFDSTTQATQPCPTAYCYRSHSGHYGIVNSIESYQNLIRFLFGQVRIDIWCDVEKVYLPDSIQNHMQFSSQTVDALYQFEIQASTRGGRWYLTRRKTEEDSVACRTYQELTQNNAERKRIYLSSIFMGKQWQVDANSGVLSSLLQVGILVSEYEQEQPVFDAHFEGGYLFQGRLLFECQCPYDFSMPLRIKTTWQHTDETQTWLWQPDAPLHIHLPLKQGKKPLLEAQLRLVVHQWQDV